MAELECTWPIDPADCCPPGSESPGGGEDSELFEKFLPVVSAMMTRWSGYRIGTCIAELRPLGPCRVCRSWCCGGADGVLLSGPNGMYVAEVTEVTIGGGTVDPAEWRFDPPTQTLWRTPTEGWPASDARWADCGEAGTFCVQATLGEEPDAWALQVAAELLCELVKSCRGEKCRIPRNATQVTSQGVTITLRDTDINHMLPSVSAWVSAVNPDRAVLPGRVWSPDLVAPGHSGNGIGTSGLYNTARMNGGGCCG